MTSGTLLKFVSNNLYECDLLMLHSIQGKMTFFYNISEIYSDSPPPLSWESLENPNQPDKQTDGMVDRNIGTETDGKDRQTKKLTS